MNVPAGIGTHRMSGNPSAVRPTPRRSSPNRASRRRGRRFQRGHAAVVAGFAVRDPRRRAIARSRRFAFRLHARREGPQIVRIALQPLHARTIGHVVGWDLQLLRLFHPSTSSKLTLLGIDRHGRRHIRRRVDGRQRHVLVAGPAPADCQERHVDQSLPHRRQVVVELPANLGLGGRIDRRLHVDGDVVIANDLLGARAAGDRRLDLGELALDIRLLLGHRHALPYQLGQRGDLLAELPRLGFDVRPSQRHALTSC